MFLNSHNDKYNLSKNDLIYSVVTGFSGMPFAQRHIDLSKTAQTKTKFWGHRCIAALESIPLIGGLAALIEKVIFLTKTKYFSSNKISSPSIPSRSTTTFNDSTKKEILENLRKFQTNNYITINPRITLQAPPLQPPTIPSFLTDDLTNQPSSISQVNPTPVIILPTEKDFTPEKIQMFNNTFSSDIDIIVQQDLPVENDLLEMSYETPKDAH